MYLLLVAHYTCSWAQFFKSGKHTKLNHQFRNWCFFCKSTAPLLFNIIYSDSLLLICGPLSLPKSESLTRFQQKDATFHQQRGNKCTSHSHRWACIQGVAFHMPFQKETWPREPGWLRDPTPAPTKARTLNKYIFVTILTQISSSKLCLRVTKLWTVRNSPDTYLL